ncbi:MAG TPA: beta-ketoacyl-ACP synthase 3 [Bryobacteraceae bacterium]|nr:beta-ketoacyl-ACP synthase 3 [Bryobacteraceae bacterium]
MASFLSFGRYLPERILGNDELSRTLGCDPEWILQATGIEERRIAGPAETVADLGVQAAQDCLRNQRSPKIGLIIAASGSSERRFPGPAAEIGHKLGLSGVPAIDLPLASAGSLFAISLAAHLAPACGTVLVVAAEKMSGPAAAAPVDRNTAILFGDGAGACLISTESAGLQILDSALHSDGANTAALHLELSGPVQMNGMAVIRHATRRLPEVILEVLERNQVRAADVSAFVMHQANQNLIDRVARTLDAPSGRFYSNIRRYGNTSSASMLIAAAEWREQAQFPAGDTVCFATFGAGFHWGALLARER